MITQDKPIYDPLGIITENLRNIQTIYAAGYNMLSLTKTFYIKFYHLQYVMII
jgi:hypothetical protein